ncbi:MAG: M48 family metallopeptidase [Balneola sp.]
MPNKFFTAKELAEKIRFSGDKKFTQDSLSEFSNDKHNNTFSHADFPITEKLTPSVFDVLVQVCRKLNLDSEKVKAFVFSSSTIQAQCISGNSSDCIIRISSALIEILELDEIAFVLGHELGHFLLSHGVYQMNFGSDSLENLLTKRAQEVSVDRLGYFAAGSLESSIKALMKTASGLSDKYLRFDISSYMTHLKEPEDDISLQSTHPSILFRCRALLWFSMNYQNMIDVQEIDRALIDKLDEKVLNDMNRYIDGPALNLIEDAKHNLSMWLYIKLILNHGSFDKNSQQIFLDQFGENYFNKFVNLLNNNSLADISEIVELRLLEYKDSLKTLIPLQFDFEYSTMMDRVKKRLSEE